MNKKINTKIIRSQQIKKTLEKRNEKPHQISRNAKPKVKQSFSQFKKVSSIPRPDAKYLTSLAGNIKTIILPEKGSFNAGLAKLPNSNNYVCVYRPDEYSFIGCILNEKLNVISKYKKFDIKNCADPRIIWTSDKKLLMIYSSVTDYAPIYECIRGSIIMDLNQSDDFIDHPSFRVSPESIKTRQKNWMPFIWEDRIFLIASVCPHIIYELDLSNFTCEQKYETDWVNPWMYKDFLRGNTNAVQLTDGNFLGTFHTASWHGPCCYYDNGAYLFEGKPPFKVLKCANRTYLKAEDAVQKHFRNAGRILCTFPVGMVRNDNDILISYGDNDSVVKVMKTSVDEMKNLMLDVY